MSRIEKALEKFNQGTNNEPKNIPEEVKPAESSATTTTVKTKYFNINLKDVDKHIVSVLEPVSFVSEQFKQLRTQLLRLKENNGVNLIMVTSSVREEGKSVVALNLAISLSLGLKETVLLVDADLRKPSITSMLGINASQGLSDFLSQNLDLPDLLIRTDINKLTILPSGTIPPNPSELLGSDKMVDFLQDIKKRYSNRFIIIDTPPVLLTTDAAVIGPKVDGALMVVCAHKTRKQELESSLTILKKTRMLGLVLNKSNPEETKKYHKSIYGYKDNMAAGA